MGEGSDRTQHNAAQGEKMKIISSVGAKGGSGKSSIALLLAWELAKGKKVAVLDADIQGTCMSAKVMNPSAPFEVFSVLNKAQLWQKGKELSDQAYDYCLIDGNPRSLHEDPALIEIIAKLSDLNLIISRPSPRDVKAQIAYVSLVKNHTKGNVRLLWNFYQKQTGAHKEGVPEAEALLGLQSLQTRIGQRIAFQDLGYTEGHISSLGNAEAAKEALALAKEVRGLLNGKA